MRDAWLRIKDKVIGSSERDYDYPDEFGEDYLEIDSEEQIQQQKPKNNKITVRPFIIKEFADVKVPLDILREGYTIALLNIKDLKKNDMIELKRVINKLKKTCDAMGGDIAGFGEDWLVITPSFAEVYRAQKP